MPLESESRYERKSDIMMQNQKPYTLEEINGLASHILTQSYRAFREENLGYHPNAGLIIDWLEAVRPRVFANSGYSTYPIKEGETYDPYDYLRCDIEAGRTIVIDCSDEAYNYYIVSEEDESIRQRFVDQIVERLKPILLKD